MKEMSVSEISEFLQIVIDLLEKGTVDKVTASSMLTELVGKINTVNIESDSPVMYHPV